MDDGWNEEATVCECDAASIYHLKISLEGVEPPIWRLLQVPGNASLGWLHAVIQVAMGWTNSHLHQFVVGNRLYSDSSVTEGGLARVLMQRDGVRA